MTQGFFAGAVPTAAPYDQVPRLIGQIGFESAPLDYVINAFNKVVPSITTKIKELTSSFDKDDAVSADVKKLNELFQSTSKRVSHLNFVDYSKVVTTIPEGYKGNLLLNLKIMLELMGIIYNTTEKALIDYKGLLSTLVSNKEFKKASRDHRPFFKQLDAQRVKSEQQLATVFPSADSQSRTFLGSVLNNFSELDDIVKVVNQLDKENRQKSLPALKKEIDRCVELLDILQEQIKEEGVSQVNQSAAINISEGAYSLAKMVELVAVFHFRAEQIIVCSLNILKTIDDLK